MFTSVTLMVIYFAKWVLTDQVVVADSMDLVAQAEMMKFMKLAIVFFCVTFVPFIPMVIVLRKLKKSGILNQA